MKLSVTQISATLFSWISAEVGRKSPQVPPEAILWWGETEWKVAREIVLVHGFGPVWGRLCKAGFECSDMPGWFRVFLLQQYASNVQRTKRIKDIRSQLSAALGANGIAFSYLKGLDFAVSVYEDIYSRPMSDIDILLTGKYNQKFPRILDSLGFDLVHQNLAYAENYVEKRFTEAYGSLNSGHQTKISGGALEECVGIDVHHAMLEVGTTIDLTAMFQEAAQASRSLTPEESYLYLVLHAARHCVYKSGRWLQLYDIYLFEKSHTINKEALIALVVELRVNQYMAIPTFLMEKVFNVESYLGDYLRSNVSRRHLHRIEKNDLVELSHCNPWEPSVKDVLMWAASPRDVIIMIAQFVRGMVRKRQPSSHKGTTSGGSSKLRLIQRLLPGRLRPEWAQFSALGLDPLSDWK
jgi:hypothetical protein